MLVGIKEKWFSDNFKDILDLDKIKGADWNIEASSFYASGQSTSYFGDGLYSNLSLGHRLEIAGLPVAVSADLVLQNNQVNQRLSAIGIEFDQAALIDKYKQQTGKRAVQQSFNNLLDEQKQALREHFSIEASRRILLSESYQIGKNALINRIDSLAGQEQSKGDSTLLDSLQAVRKDIERTEHRVDSIYNAGLANWDETQQTLQEWRSKVVDQQALLEEKAENGSLHKYINKYAGKKNWRAALLNLSQVKLGSFQLRGSPFDIVSVPLHGISTEIRRNGYYAMISYGKEGKQRRQFPDYVRNIRLAGQGRTILQVKAGLGMPEKSHLHLGFSSIRVAGDPGDSLYSAFPKRNVLISLDSRYLVAEHLFVEMLGSVSRADFTNTSSTKELLNDLYTETAQGRNNMAGLLRFGWRDKKGQSEYTVGYQVVGSHFITLGNLFLINNRNAVRLEGKQKFLHNRGQLKVAYINGTTNQSIELTPGIKQNQFSGEFSYRLNKYGSRAWASYSPNFYQQNAPGSGSAIYQLNLATVGTQWMFPRGKKGQWMSLLQLTNYSDQSLYGDTSVVTGLWYGMFTQTYSSDKYQVTGLANFGLDKDNPGSVRDINVEANQSFVMKRFQLSQGLQIVKRFYGAGVLAGGSGGIQINVGKRIRAGISGTYLIGLSNGEKNQFYMNSSASWQF